MNCRELGRELSRLGTAEDRVKVLDVDHSATTYKLPQIEQRVRVGAFYMRPPEGVTAQTLKEIFDQCDDPAFRYKITSGIGTDHVELLTPDEFARQYFSGAIKLIHIEGSRKVAREQLDEVFDEMKEEFDAQRFPRLDDVTISGYKQGNDESSTEVKLLVYDDDFRNMSRIERDITIKISEGNLHREIDVRRHLVKESKPEIMLSSTAKATNKGRTFLDNLATFLLARDGGIQTQAKRAKTTLVEKTEPRVNRSAVQAFPKAQAVIKKPGEIVNNAVSQFYDTLLRMSAFKELDVKKLPRGILVQFPKKMFGGRQFEAWDLRELRSVYNTILGSPGLHDGWSAYHLYDKKERLLKIRFTAPDEELDSPWSRLGKA